MATFEEAVENMNNKVNRTLSPEEQLGLYSLYKQALFGDCNTDKPGAMDIKSKSKWDAWNTQKGLSQEDAKAQYTELAERMLQKHGSC